MPHRAAWQYHGFGLFLLYVVDKFFQKHYIRQTSGKLIRMSSINLFWLVSSALCLFVGWLLRGGYQVSALHTAEIRAAQAESLAEERLDRLNDAEVQLLQSQENLEQSVAENFSRQTAVDTARARLQQHQVAGRQQVALLEKRNLELKEQIEAISARVFADNSHRMTEITEVHLQHLLTPLREQIGEFKQRVEEVYDKEQKDRYQLKAEIGQLKTLNERISADAINLSNALRGDNKTLGSWGELILERVLERAGLSKGREYDREVSLENSDGVRFRPDALLYLPGNKSIIIDSKASIKFYEKSLHEAIDASSRTSFLREHVKSIKKHIEGLSAKGYETLEGVNSLDFVLMFVPVEAALQAALEFDDSLYYEAYDRDVVLVGPSSLMVTCRTIQNVWHSELQNKNSRLIAKRAGELVDRFNGFVTELDNISKALEAAVVSCEGARRKLATGRGNLVGRAQQLRELGAHTTKSMATKNMAGKNKSQAVKNIAGASGGKALVKE